MVLLQVDNDNYSITVRPLLLGLHCNTCTIYMCTVVQSINGLKLTILPSVYRNFKCTKHGSTVVKEVIKKLGELRWNIVRFPLRHIRLSYHIVTKYQLDAHCPYSNTIESSLFVCTKFTHNYTHDLVSCK